MIICLFGQHTFPRVKPPPKLIIRRSINWLYFWPFIVENRIIELMNTLSQLTPSIIYPEMSRECCRKGVPLLFFLYVSMVHKQLQKNKYHRPSFLSLTGGSDSGHSWLVPSDVLNLYLQFQINVWVWSEFVWNLNLKVKRYSTKEIAKL